jgi:hypothetical protein
MVLLLSDFAAVKQTICTNDEKGARVGLGGVSLDLFHGLPEVTDVNVLSAMGTGHRVYLDHSLTWSAWPRPMDRAESLYSKVRSGAEGVLIASETEP